MDRWDNKESSKHQNLSLGSKRTLFLLIGVMALMWGMLGITSYYTEPDNCIEIQQFVGSYDFYDLSSEMRQKYLDAQYQCTRDNIIIK